MTYKAYTHNQTMRLHLQIQRGNDRTYKLIPEYENLHTQRDLTMVTVLSVVERDSHVS